MKQHFKKPQDILFLLVSFLLIVYVGIFSYLNLAKYTQHVDSDIAVDAILAREIWVEKDLTPSNWISSTERLVVSVPLLSSLLYGLTGSMVFSMGLSCTLVGILLLGAIAFTFRRCHISRLAGTTALLALCALPINGLRNEDQMVPFVTLLWFLFADYYALHSICLFLSLSFYIYLVTDNTSQINKPLLLMVWGFLALFCAGLALGGMRCLQVVALPLAVWEVILIFSESRRFTLMLSRRRMLGCAFIFSLAFVACLAKLYPTSVEYPMFFQTSGEMVSRLFLGIPAAILECLGIAGNCKLTSFSALMQLGILAVVALTIYGLIYLLSPRSNVCKEQKLLIGGLSASFLLTVFIEMVTTAELAQNYFFVVWFVIIAVLAALITNLEKVAPLFSHLLVVCICIFALLNIKFTWADCVATTDNLQEYEEVISYMEAQDITYGYAEFWDASRICIMTDGKITMGHSYQMEELGMYWWTTSTKWYVPNLPEDMKTAYVVKQTDKAGFEAQFTDPGMVTLGFENERFAVYISDRNYVRMQ